MSWETSESVSGAHALEMTERLPGASVADPAAAYCR
jgi:hypothetical protein